MAVVNLHLCVMADALPILQDRPVIIARTQYIREHRLYEVVSHLSASQQYTCFLDFNISAGTCGLSLKQYHHIFWAAKVAEPV